jgi:uroporphyrinogen decarboxylase
MKEFGWYCLERWEREGHIKHGENLAQRFGLEESGVHILAYLGGCEAAVEPPFENKVLEDLGKYEIVQDQVGRHVKCFKGRRNGFMPEYVDHPVKDRKSWEENIKWRLDPTSAVRRERFDANREYVRNQVERGKLLSEIMPGGYMYLRSLFGPMGLLYAFYDQPELVHDCMQAWLAVNDAVMAYHQESFDLDEVFLDEDICYNHGSLISHDMIREFLFPYYQQLITNVKMRNKDKTRKVHVQIATDGAVHGVIDLYKEIGMTFMAPFEVASGCDVVELGQRYPDLLMSGGFDKRILAQGKEAIDREIDRIMPVMYKRGGYIPTCDHGVPEEVSFENYVYYRERMKEYAN